VGCTQKTRRTKRKRMTVMRMKMRMKMTRNGKMMMTRNGKMKKKMIGRKRNWRKRDILLSNKYLPPHNHT